MDGPAYSLTRWDPDGAGPLPPVVVACGNFALAGDQLATGLATLDVNTSTIAAFPSITGRWYGPSIVMPNGDLVVSGLFGTNTNGAYRIARWNGTSWTFLGADLLIGPPRCFAVSPLGDLYASSLGLLPRGLPYTGVARWNGTSWEPLPDSSQLGGPLLFLPNGDLVAVGAYIVKRWDGASWHTLGNGQGFDGSGVYSLALAGNGDIIAVGSFYSDDGVTARAAARWNGVSWSAMSSGLASGDYGEDVVPAPNGDVVATFTIDNTSVLTTVRRWNGVSWLPVGPTLNGKAQCVTVLPDGAVLVGGNFFVPGTPFARNLALARAGQSMEWTGFGNGMTFRVRAQVVTANGDLVVAGGEDFENRVRGPGRLFRWNNGAWTGLGPDLTDPINALAIAPNGDLIAGGAFTYAGDVVASHIARWNGSAWSPLGYGSLASVTAVAVLPNGDIIAGGLFPSGSHIARWNGSQWLPLGQGIDGEVDALLVLPNGDIVAGGSFTHADSVPASRIARWDGSAWAPMGDGLNSSVLALALLRDGSLIAGGQFSQSGPTYVSHIARWDGQAWTAFGNQQGPVVSIVRTLCALPNGDVFAGGDFAPGPTVERWDGTRWSAVRGSPNATVNSIAVLPDGDISVGGRFTSTGAGISAYVARFMFPSIDYDRDGDPGTNADIQAFFACLAGDCCPACPPNADFDGDGDIGTDADIEAFFRMLAGWPC